MPHRAHGHAADPDPESTGEVRSATALRTWRYLWAGPTTLLGLFAGALTLASRGQVERRDGVIELSGGFAAWLLSSRLFRAQAMALGHVVLGRNQWALDRCRDHELVHVRQAERWGPFFLPAYLWASVWAHLDGRHYYRENRFEIEAVAESSRRRESNRLDAGANG